MEAPLENALQDAKLTKKEIDEIILVGGSTFIPKVKTIIKNYFPNSKINNRINPEDAVAYGATLLAEKILHPHDLISKFCFIDITPFSLGVNTYKDEMHFIIKRGTKIPTSFSAKYYYGN